MSQTTIVTYQEKYLPAFANLNREWIQKYFTLEPMDLAQLEKPHDLILNPGGEIFFLLEDGIPVGTCAMAPHDGVFELAKMAILPSKRGLGYGDLLMQAAIDWAKEKNLPKIILLSNTVLEPAISLYKKHGFKTVHLGSHPDYQRCNIIMELAL